jgi:glutamine amidotransferase
MTPILIVDYGMGNLGSVLSMLRRVGVPALISGDVAEVRRARKIILPGVGAYDNAMKAIAASGLREALDQKALTEGVPVLGICLGMQLLMEGSEEGREPGLGWIPGRAHRFPTIEGLKVPHMGWNEVRAVRDDPLIADLGDEPRFYFVHSYQVQAADPSHALLKADYGLAFDAAVRRDNIWGAQFHPEKSHRFGRQLLANFAAVPC